MAKQLNVNLAFTADTSQAKTQLKELEKSLQNIAKMPGKASSLFDDKEIKQASQAALELQQHLAAATNVNTGNLDLSRFSTSLKASGRELNDYYNKLIKIGPEGEQAFLQLARSISTAEAPVTRVNKRLAEMGTVIKNTAKWQISSSILHGFMGTLQGAYGYAQDLNESLNNIRIVTGQSTEQMAQFAQQANKAAKELSTTTTAYTDAALIFYQQGLSGDDVTQRTDTVVKMANVTGESAADVSSYMTAIWNNFADGSDNLEHFADVITALGATTASSSAEIAEGLEKFASIGDTVGLSYDYATSALATVVAATRQSADSIGTSFKTIFSRLQGLKLGETLEDGVDLNKYSKALNTVGVQVLDTAGNMRKLDEILDDLAGKWDNLSKAEQTALAQTVAGTRQYNTLMALMTNWDSMTKNLDTARNSDDSLQKQADIYAESWDAAQKRVKAAAQGIYDSILNDDFFINLTNGFAKVLESIEGLVDGLGGMKGVITSIGAIFLNIYAAKMPEVLNNLRQNFMVLTGQANKLMTETQSSLAIQLKDIQNNSNYTASFKVQAEGIAKINEMQQKLALNTSKMTQAEIDSYKVRMQNVESMYKEVAALTQVIESLQKEEKAQKAIAEKEMISGARNLIDDYEGTRQTRTTAKAQQTKAKNIIDTEANTPGSFDASAIEAAKAQLQTYTNLLTTANSEMKQYKDIAVELSGVIKGNGDEFNLATSALQKMANGQKITSDEAKALEKTLKNQVSIYEELASQYYNLEQVGTEIDGQFKSFSNTIKEDSNSLEGIKEKLKEFISLPDKSEALTMAGEDIEKLKMEIDGLNNAGDLEALGQRLVTSLKTPLQQVEQDCINLQDALRNLPVDPKVIQDLDAIIAKLQSANKNAGDARANINGLGSDIGNTMKISQGLSNFTSAVMSLSMAINSINNALKTMNDENATGAEKFGAFASVLMSVTMCAKSFGTVISTAGQEAVFAAIGVHAAWWEVYLVLGIIVGAIALIVKAWKNYEAQQPEGKLKAATKEAEKLSDALAEAKTEAENLASAFDNYDSLVTKLEDCTKGTQEWKDAIQEVNQEVLELLNNYPELSNYISRNSDGMLTISDEGRDVLNTLANNKINGIQAAKNQADNEVRQNRLDVKREQIGNDFYGLSHAVKRSDDYFESMARYEGHTKDDGSEIQATLDAIELLSNNMERFSGLTEGANHELSKEIKSLLSENGLTTTDEMAQIWANEFSELGLDSKIHSLTIALDENTKASKIATQANIDNKLKSNDKVQNSNFADEIAQASYRQYDKIRNQKESDLTKEYGNQSKAAEIAWRNAAIELGWSGADKKDDNNKYVETLDAIKEFVISNESLTELDLAASNLVSTFTELNNAGDKGLLQFLTNGDLTSLTEEEVNTLRGRTFTQEDADKYGFENAQSMVDAINESLHIYDNAVQDFKNELNEHYLNAVKDFILDNNDVDFKKIDLNTQKIIADMLEKALVEGGEPAFKTLSATMTDLLKNSNFDKFNDVVLTFDFSKNSLENFNKQLKEAGVDAQLDEDAFNALSAAMNQTADSAETLTASFKQNNDIVKGLSKQGDTISDDDFQKLDAAYQSWFVTLMDGTHKLIGNAKELQEAVRDDYINKTAKIYNNQQQSVSNIADYLDSIPKKQVQKWTENGEHAYYEEEIDADLTKNASVDNGQRLSVDSELVTAQIAQQKALGDASVYSKEELAKLDEQFKNNTATFEDYQKLAESCTNSTTDLANASEYLIGQMYQEKLAIAESYNSMKDLRDAYEEGKLGPQDDALTIDAYNTAAVHLDQQEDTSMLNQDELEAYADYLEEAENMTKEEAEVMAKSLMKMNDAVETLSKNFYDLSKADEGWYSVLSKSSKGSQEYAEAMMGTKAAVAELLDISKDYVSQDFIANNLELIQKAAQGDADAIDELRTKLSDLNEEGSAVNKIADSLDPSKLDEFKSGYAELQDMLADGFDVSLDEIGQDGFIDALNKMIEATGMTTDQINAMLDSMGFEAKFKEVDQQTETKIPKYIIHHEPKGNPFSGEAWTEDMWVEKGEEPVSGAIPIFGMTTDGSEPKISTTVESVSKKASGSSNNYSKSNSGGKAAPSKAKGGGGSKKKDKDDKKLDEEFNRYHDIERAIKGVNTELSNHEKLQSHMYGKQLANSLREENALLEKQKANYEKLLAAQKQELSEVAGKLEDYGVEFDYASGEITNYAQITLHWLQKYNAAVQALKNGTMEQEAFDAIEKSYNDFKKQIGLYDQILDKMQDTQDKINDTIIQEVENNLKAWEAEIEVKLKLEEAKREWQRFMDEINTDFTLHYKDVTGEMTGQAHSAASLVKTIQTDIDAMKDIENEFYAGSDSSMFMSSSEAQNKLYEYRDKFQSDAEALYKLYQDTWNSYLEGIDIAKDKLDDLISEFEFIDEDLDHQAKMMQLIYGDTDYNGLSLLYDAQSQNSLATLDSLRQQVDMWKQQYDIAVQLHGENSEAAVKMYDYWHEAISDLHAEEEKYLDDIQNKYKNTIDSIFDDLDKKLSGSEGGLDWLKEQWDATKEASAGYYDDVERVYQLEKLRGKYQKEIDNTSSLTQQSKLKTMMESQLSALEEKNDLSEYDVTLAEKRLEVMKAQMALEDARDAKQDLKLTRDNQGNWIYEYTADLDTVNEKEQDYLDKQNDAYEYAKQSWEEMQSTILTTTQAAIDKIKEINLAMLSATDEQRSQLEAQRDWYLSYYDGLLDTQLNASQNMGDNFLIETGASNLSFYEAQVESYSNMTEEEKALIDELRNHSITSVTDIYTATDENLNLILDKSAAVQTVTSSLWTLGAADIIKAWYTNPDSVASSLKKAIDQCIDAMNEYVLDVNKGCIAAGEDFTDVGERIKEDIAYTQSLGVKTTEVVSAICKELGTYQALLTTVKQLWESMLPAIKAAGEAVLDVLGNDSEWEKFLGNLDAAISKASKLKEELQAAAAAAAEAGSAGPSSGDGHTYTMKMTGAQDYTVYDENGTAVYTGTAEACQQWIKDHKDKKGEVKGGKAKGGIVVPSAKVGGVIMPFAQGGTVPNISTTDLNNLAHTAGEDTMIAVKYGERVLSNHQTAAFDKLIYDVLPKLMNNNIVNMLSKLNGNTTINNTNNDSSGASETNIYNIQADFPNVTNSHEIEEALLSLNSYASQYVWDSKK